MERVRENLFFQKGVSRILFSLPFLMLAKLCKRANIALRCAGGANISAELDDAVAKIALLALWQERIEKALDLGGILLALGIESDPAANANTMRIGHKSAGVIDVAEEQVGNLSADAGQSQEFFHIVGQATAIDLHKHPAGFFCVFGFGVKKSAGAQDAFKLGKVGIGEIARRGIDREEIFCGQVDPCVGALCRKATHNEEPPRLSLPVKGAGRVGIDARERIGDVTHFFLFFRWFHGKIPLFRLDIAIIARRESKVNTS